MAKIAFYIMLISLLFTSCVNNQAPPLNSLSASPTVADVVSAAPDPVDALAPTDDVMSSALDDLDMLTMRATPVPFNERYNSIAGNELSDEQIAEIAKYLINAGHRMMNYYHFPGLPFDWDDSFREGHLTYWRVIEFSTIQSLKDAFESIYSMNRVEEDVYSSHIFSDPDVFAYVEKDGVLYAREGWGGGKSFLIASDIMSVVSQEPERIVVRTGLSSVTPSDPDYVELTIIRERGRWVLDSSLVSLPS